MTTTTQAQVAVGVQATLAAYARALDNGRTDEVVALFRPDGIAEIAGMGTFQGHDAIREIYAGLVPAQPQLHLVTNTVISSWNDHEVAATSNFTFLQRGESGWVVPVTGRYEDVFHKDDDGTWRIFSRTTTYVI
jgi:3-phenylpropionate/cinnamic acid dioxygenase small subunit